MGVMSTVSQMEHGGSVDKGISLRYLECLPSLGIAGVDP